MIPESLVIENFLSHDYSEINFNDFNVALILGSYDGDTERSNGAGKSAIFEALTWALFGRSRHKKKDGVVKHDKRTASVTLTFYVESELYRIIRKRDKTLGESEVILEVWKNDEFQSISCDTNTATDKKIVSIVGFVYEVFVTSAYFKQNDINLFPQATPSKRKDILKSLLRLEIWDAYQKKAADNRKKIQSKITEKEKDIIPIDTLKTELSKYKKESSEIRKKIKEYDYKYKTLSEGLINAKSEYQSLYGEAIDKKELTKLQKEYSQAKKRRKEILNKIQKNNDTIKANSDNKSKYQQKVEVCKSKIAEGKNIDIDPVRNKFLRGNLKKESLQEEINKLSKPIKIGNHCNECERPVTKNELENLKNKRKEKLFEAKNRISRIKSKLDSIGSEIKTKEGILEAASKAEITKNRMELKITECDNNVKFYTAENDRLQTEVKQIESRNYKEEISKLKDRFDKEKEEKLKENIDDLEFKLGKMRSKYNKLNVELGSKTRKQKEISNTKKEQLELQKELDKLNADYAIYDKLAKYFGRDGIQAVIIENVIEELENYANATLSKMYNEPLTLSIKTQRENDNGSWSETFDIDITSNGITDEFSTFSGGEQFRISLALRLALSKILAKRMGGTLGFLLLDEVSSSLDDKGLAMFIDIVKQLGQELKVLVITHDDTLKDRFDNIIMVNKNSSGSKVIFH